MKISVVTICRNAESTIGRTIESFLRQTYRHKEMIVVDGASNDTTLAIANSHASELIRIHSESDRGIYDAMNKGIRLFRGEAVGFLNADDMFHDSYVLEKIADGLAGSDAVYGDLLMVEKSGRLVRRWQAGAAQPFRTGWMPPHPTFYARRALVEAVGAFDPELDIAADYDFMLRALEVQRARARYIPHTLVDFSIGGHSTRNTAAVIRANLQCLGSRRRHLAAPPLDWALFAKPARKLAQLRWP